MSFSVQTAKSELQAMLHGTTLNQVENIDGVFNRAARQLLLDIDPAETSRIALLATPIYNQVYDYAPPTDLKGNKIIDLIVQGSGNQRPVFTQLYNQDFDLGKDMTLVNNLSIQYNTGVQTLKICYVNSSRTIGINDVSSITGNGTWAAGGTASNLTVNNVLIVNNQSVLQFDITTGTGTMTNSTMAAVDLTAHEDQSELFWTIYVPLGSSLTSLSIRFGSDASNYWEKTGITTNFQGNAFDTGLNQIGTPWSGMTQTGSPDVSAVTYVQISYVASANMAGVALANINSQLGYLANISYYSRYLFRTSAGVWQETVTEDSNLINLNTDSYNVFLWQVALGCVQQSLGQDATFDTNFFSNNYQQALTRYKKMYKSQIQKAQAPYYQKTFNGYTEWLGSNYSSW